MSYPIMSEQMPDGPAALSDRLSGLVLVATAILVFLAETAGGTVYSLAAGAAIVLYLALVTPGVCWSRQIFVATDAALFAVAMLTRPDWPAMTGRALASASFIAPILFYLDRTPEGPDLLRKAPNVKRGLEVISERTSFAKTLRLRKFGGS